MLLAVLDRLLDGPLHVSPCRGVVAEFLDPLRDDDLDDHGEKEDQRLAHNRPKPLDERGERWSFSNDSLYGGFVGHCTRARGLQERFEPEKALSGQPRGGQNVDRVVEDIECPVRKLRPSTTTRALLAVALQGDVVSGPRYCKQARLEDESACWTEGRESDGHALDIDTFSLAVYAVASILGSLVGGAVVLAIW